MDVISTYDFLWSIDPDLCQYMDILRTKGFNNTRVLRHLIYDDLDQIPIGHRRLLLNEVSKIHSPHSKALLTSLDAQSIQVNKHASNPHSVSAMPTSSLQPKSLFPLTPTNNPENKSHINAYSYTSPMEKHLNRILKDVNSKQKEIDAIKSKIEDMQSLLEQDEYGH